MPDLVNRVRHALGKSAAGLCETTRSRPLTCTLVDLRQIDLQASQHAGQHDCRFFLRKQKETEMLRPRGNRGDVGIPQEAESGQWDTHCFTGQ